MNIVHVCLAGVVTDGFSYQDNLLSKYHKKFGNNVSIITSQFMWSEQGTLIKDNRQEYKNIDGVKMIRLPIKRNKSFHYKFKKYKGLYETLEKLSPNILFIHGCQFMDIKLIVKFIKENQSVKVYLDNHADFSNSANTFLSKYILHKIIWKRKAKLIEPFVEKFYGVMPSRVKFLNEMYNIPKEKIELLLMGVDDEKVAVLDSVEIRESLYENYNVKENDHLIVTGGKIDKSKYETIHLIKAIKNIDKPDIKLVIFGSIAEKLKPEIEPLIDNEKIIYVGWINTDEIYKLFISATLGVFPGRHSVLWEQAVGVGLPCLFKKWNGTDHVDVGGNCDFLIDANEKEIKDKILNLIYTDNYNTMKQVAIDKGIQRFSYKNIAKRSIDLF